MNLINDKKDGSSITREGRGYTSKLDNPAGFSNEFSILPKFDSRNEFQSNTDQNTDENNFDINQVSKDNESFRLEDGIVNKVKRFSSRLYDN